MIGRVLPNGKKGQSLVETALVLPILIWLLCGIVDFGLLFSDYLTINNASREGARTAATGATDAQIRTSIMNHAGTLDEDDIIITITPTEGVRKSGDEITITVEYKHTLFTPIISSLLGDDIDLDSKTVMRME